MGRLKYLTAAAAVAFAATAALAEPEHDRARRLVDEGQILPLESLLEQVRTERPGRVLEVELEEKRHGLIYEIEILDAEGRVWELKYDARTGELLEHEQED